MAGFRPAEGKAREPAAKPSAEPVAAEPTPGLLAQQFAFGLAGPARGAAASPPALPRLTTATRVQRRAAEGEPAPFGTIVDDDVEPAPGQMRRSQFIAAAYPAIEEAATAELAPSGRTAKDCPYIERYMNFYRDQSASHIERVIAKYAQPRETDVPGLIVAMVERVRAAVVIWLASGRIELPATQPAAKGGEPAPGPVQGFDGALGADPRGVRARLGAGRALDRSTRSRMERGFGSDFGDVRIHDDARAARTATALSARAFTVGHDVAFAAGQFRPGTLRGDLMIAHELAHVVQQRGGGAATQAFSASGEGALEADADRAALSAMAQVGLAPAELGRHIAHHPPIEGQGLRLQRCDDTEDVDYSEAPEPPDYDEVVADLRVLYAKKAQLGRAVPLDQEAYDQVNAQIQARLDELKLLGVSIDDAEIEKAVTAEGGPKELRIAKPRITRDPETGSLYIGKRMTFRLATDWLPPDEVPQISWRWKAAGQDEDLLHKSGPTCVLDEEFWGTIGPGPAILAGRYWREAGGASFYARIKLGSKPSLDSSTLWVPWDDRKPHEIPGEVFEIAPDKPVIVVGEDANVRVKNWTNRHTVYWVEWTIDGKVINLERGMGGGVLGRPFDKPGTKQIQARLFLNGEFDEDKALASASTQLEVQDVVGAGELALQKGQELGAYRPLTDFRKNHEAAMAAMGTQAKIGETGGAREYWQQRLNAARDQMKSLEERVPDWEKGKHVSGADFASALAKPDAAAVSSTPIPTVIVYPQKSKEVVQPLSIYLMTRKRGDKWVASVVDLSGAKVFVLDGSEQDTSLAAAKSAFQAWKDDNKYPIGGTLIYSFSPPGWDFAKKFGTTTAWKIAEEFLDGLIKLGTYLVIGLLMLAPDASITKVLGAALAAAVVTRGAMAIKDNLAMGGSLLDKENIIEGIAILTALLGAGGAVTRALGGAASRSSTLFRAGNWMIMGSFVVGGGTFIYATGEALAKLRQVLRDPTLTDSDRSQQLLSIISGLIANGYMQFVSGKALWNSGMRASDFFKKTIPPKGSGPIEMTEGMRLDLEVALRKRGVRSDALKAMSNEALLDNYYSLTATKPELVAIPKQWQSLPGAEAAAKMKLPSPPAGYQWAKSEGRLTVVRKKGHKGDKLVYDPESQTFIKDPTVGSKRPHVVAAEKALITEVEAASKQAVAAREAITGVPSSKTGARTPDGTSKLSGWGSDVNSLAPVEQLSAKIGHKPKPNMNDAPGKPGSYHNSHAEKQLAAAKPGEPIGVSRPMCLDCQVFFAKLANHTGRPVVVSEPGGIRIFLPQKQMATAPNAAAVAGVVASAEDALEQVDE